MIAAADARWRAELRYVARALPVATIAAIFIAAAVPTLWTVVRGRSTFGFPLVAASFVGIVTAFAVDDPAGELTAASVVPLWRRRALRVAAVAVPTAAVWGGLLAIMSLVDSHSVSPLMIPVREVVTTGAIALGLAAYANRRDPRAAAAAGAFGAVLAVLVVSALAFRVRWLPSLGMAEHHQRWWFAAASGAAIAVLTSRDDAARALITRRRSPERKAPDPVS